ncbi:MAG: riboflavin synthase [Cyanobacteria bacterium Co-bin13]|nr:riboflavin synthase [Cyanobacteria bacterium Co-bin13]
MFTGLIQALGKLYSASSTQLRIDCDGPGCDRILHDLELGDSIAVDGVCLTVEQILQRGFIASVSPETLARATLGGLPEGAIVNLESSLRVGSKIGGHFVTGHIDGRGVLESATETARAWELRFKVPDVHIARYIVPKGSIAVNGISLTVATCSQSGDWFTVAVIPVTYAETNLQRLSSGDLVNLEGDVLGKYVEKFTQGESPAEIVSTPEEYSTASVSEPLSLEFLTEHGYL